MRKPKPKHIQIPLELETALDKERAANQRWRDSHKEHIAEYNRQYHAAHKAKRSADNKRWREENKWRRRRYQREWNLANAAHRQELNARWGERHPRYRPDYKLKYNYGITLEQYEKMFQAQDGKCAICPNRAPESGRVRRLHVDHDHKCCPGNRACGKCVRGLLCSRCNLVIGSVEENMELLIQMIEYIRAHTSPTPQ